MNSKAWSLVGVLFILYLWLFAAICAHAQPPLTPAGVQTVGNPLVQGLVAAYAPGIQGMGGDRLIDFSRYRLILDSWVGPPTWVVAGLEFSSSDQRIVGSSSSFPALGTGDYTVLIGATSASRLVGVGLLAFDTYDPCWLLNENGQLYGYDSEYFGNSTGTVSEDTYAQLGWVRTGTGSGELHYYIDGVAAGTGQHAVSMSAPTSVVVGSDRVVPGTSSFEGTIHYVLIYDRAITVSEIRQLYVDPLAWARPSQPVSLWAILSGEAAPAGGNIGSINGIDWANVGSVNWIDAANIGTINGIDAN